MIEKYFILICDIIDYYLQISHPKWSMQGREKCNKD